MTAECLNCVRLGRALEAAQRDMENLEVELRVKRAQVTKLRTEAEEQIEEDPSLKDAKAIFTYWRGRLHPLAKSFVGKRRRAVLEALKSYTVLDLVDAIDGAKVSARYPAMSELEYICRDATIIDRYRCAAAAHVAWQDRSLVGLAEDFEVTEELVVEGIAILSAQREIQAPAVQRAVA